MKKLINAATFLAIYTTFAFGQQQINKCTPFGNTIISPNGVNEIKVEIKLKTGTVGNTNTMANK